MTYGHKARPYFMGTHLTRKDYSHQRMEYFMSWYSKKFWRKEANRNLRRHKGDLADGAHYKKVMNVRNMVI
ncbi:MAG: hypothetical protein Q8P93_00410 [bacterium]|nr:hypothetical protein [bacterium]